MGVEWIVDAQKVFGKGWFLTNVQAHTIWVHQVQVGLTVFKTGRQGSSR